MYHALYRKYRPTNFSSVVGQDSIVKTLKNSIINNSFSHAYIFFGPRGTGKTSVSKIFARSINCLSPVDGEACGKCKACEVSFSKECVDIIEIDAASNNGVDEIRELRNNITLVPSELKYKVYIIDEVHMLSTGAFNALLKTLEEPPEHAVFILATTDPQKVPDTIISRCQCFSFKRISSSIIRLRLDFVCNEEKIVVDDAVLDKIAVLSDGGLRDALGSLDKLLAYTNEKITLDDFNDVNGVISDEDLDLFLNKIMLGDISGVLLDIDSFNNSGKNLLQILLQLVNFARDKVVNYYLNKTSFDYSVDILQKFVNLLNEKIFTMRNSGNTKTYIEMLLLKFINDNIQQNSPVEKNIEDSPKRKANSINDVDNHKVTTSSIPNTEPVNVVDNSKDDDEFNFDDFINNDESDDLNNVELTNCSTDLSVPKILNLDEIMNARINNSFATASKDLLKIEIEKFKLLNDFSFDQEIGYLVNALLDSKVRVVGTDDMIISYDSDAAVEQNLVNIIKLNEVYNKITGSNINIAIVSEDKWNTLKKDYVAKHNKNISYSVVPEPQVLFEETTKDDIIVNSAVSLFGNDIVEIE